MKEALKDLLEAMEAAIKAGDWKVDGACDPDSAIQRARKALALQALHDENERLGLYKDAYAQPAVAEQHKQEPVATDWERIARVQDAKLRAMCGEEGGFEKLCEVMDKYERTTPPQRTWVGLTDEEIWSMDAYTMAITDQETRWLYRFARAIESKLKGKNNGT